MEEYKITAENLESEILDEMKKCTEILRVGLMYQPSEYLKELDRDSLLHLKFFGENIAEYLKNLFKMERAISKVNVLYKLYQEYFPKRYCPEIKKLEPELENLVTIENRMQKDLEVISNVLTMTFSKPYNDQKNI